MTTDDSARIEEILNFWFGHWDENIASDHSSDPFQLWFGKNQETDALMKANFAEDVLAAKEGRLAHWANDPRGCTALILLLDQFPRNIFRGSKDSFASDALAVSTSKRAILSGVDRECPLVFRMFLYMPLMHSENIEIHKLAVSVFSDLLKDAERAESKNISLYRSTVDFEQKHFAIVERFGRYPHRNAALGRTCTYEEIEFLQQPGSSF